MAKQLFSEAEAIRFAVAFEKMKTEIREDGLVGKKIDLIKNLMPSRFAKNFSAKDSATTADR